MGFDQDLFTAIEKNSIVDVRKCVFKGASIHAADYSEGGKQPIHAASAIGGDENIIHFLLSIGASVYDTDEHGQTAMHYAAYHDQLGTVELLAGERANTCKDKTGSLPIHHAAAAGHARIVECFLKKGISVDATDDKGCTPLYYAAQNGHRDAVRFLISMGADVDIKAYDGKTPLDVAKEENQADVVTILQNDKRLSALKVNDITGVEKCVFKGADIRATKKTKFGKTPLHVAAGEGNEDIILFLLMRSASVYDTDDYDQTPLHYAAYHNQLSALEILAEKGALTSGDRNGAMPIHLAAAAGHRRIVEFFLKEGVPVDATDRKGRTVLHYAARCGQLDAVRFIMGKGADVDIKDDDGKTPLDIAKEEKHDDVVTTLRISSVTYLTRKLCIN